MNNRAKISAAMLVLFCTAAVSAQRIRLDDSLSPVDTFAVEMSWPPGEIYRVLAELVAGAADATPSLVGTVGNVEVRLDTRDFVGEAARIYLALPAHVPGIGSPPDLELRWDASGNFLSGAVRPGQSTLVYDGDIDQAVTSVVFNFLVTVENLAVDNDFDLEPYYELELLP